MYARNYVFWTIPGVWCFVQFDCMKRFLQSMQFFTIPMYVQLIATAFHVLWCWLFISYLNMEVAGAAIALNISYIFSFLLGEGYVRVIGYKKSFSPFVADFFTAETTKEWCEFLRYGAPSTAMQCFEWWAFELLAIFSGLLDGNEPLAA